MVSDYGNTTRMETIAIGKFKATCLSVLERVRRTREPVLVTRRGVPVAEIKPPPQPATSWLGSMQGTIEIVGDIVTEPAEPEDAWEALRE
ncbi:MAG TPA: type II toxin-antitoxin system Phd/YefM family antitoxin [Hyphomicrobiaceae bacterium]|nr:type II toxin-antitoxin system Phd/YefM family antitoxin [Hyphomicrobiaceae bacterium]